VENQQLINALIGGGFAIIGWFARELWGAVKELRADLAALREDLPKEYVAKDDYREDIREIKALLERIFEKLDAKVDK
tara:strand:- start:415 stop:648 length:234 start_codon:yes stop_codon:yes gene_type:complete